jgi:hypothetical protein
LSAMPQLLSQFAAAATRAMAMGLAASTPSD